MTNISLAGRIDLSATDPAGIFMDINRTVDDLTQNVDCMLRILSDTALVEALDTVEDYDEITEGEAKIRLQAGLTLLFVARVRRERDRRLQGTGV